MGECHYGGFMIDVEQNICSEKLQTEWQYPVLASDRSL